MVLTVVARNVDGSLLMRKWNWKMPKKLKNKYVVVEKGKETFLVCRRMLGTTNIYNIMCTCTSLIETRLVKEALEIGDCI